MLNDNGIDAEYIIARADRSHLGLFINALMKRLLCFFPSGVPGKEVACSRMECGGRAGRQASRAVGRLPDVVRISGPGVKRVTIVLSCTDLQGKEES